MRNVESSDDPLSRHPQSRATARHARGVSATRLLLAFANGGNLVMGQLEPWTLAAGVVESICGVRAHLSIQKHRAGDGHVAYFTEPTGDMKLADLRAKGMSSDGLAIQTIGECVAGRGLARAYFADYKSEVSAPHAMIAMAPGHPIHAIDALLARHHRALGGIRVFANELAYSMNHPRFDDFEGLEAEVESLLRAKRATT